MKLKKSGVSLRHLLILGLVFFSFNSLQARECSYYLNTSDQIDSLTKEQLSALYLEEIFHKLDHLGQEVDLELISKYLTLNEVLHEFDSNLILILPEGLSPLNRFAQRLAKVSSRASLDQVAGVTKLIFDPTSLRESGAGGIFGYGSDYDLRGYPIGKFRNSITISFDAIMDLKPTTTEFHELVHWKAYFEMSQMKLDSLAFGSLVLSKKNKETSEYEFDFEGTDQTFNFTFEELPAHLLGMSKKIREFENTDDEEYKDDLAVEIVLEIEAAAYYARKMKSVVKTFFSKSFFKNIDKLNGDKLFENLVMDPEGDALSIFHHEMIENIVLTEMYRHSPGKVGIEYELKQIKSYWTMFLPLPKEYQSLEFFNKLNSEQLKNLQLQVAKSIYYRMAYLRDLIAYVEEIHTTVAKEELGIDFSPIEGFHRINRAYKDKLIEHGLN